MPTDKSTQATPGQDALEAITSEAIPPPKAEKGLKVWFRNKDALNQIERDANQSHYIRRLAAYGALGIAFLMYLLGLYAVLHIAGLLPDTTPFASNMWHIATIVVIALFSVPTVLVIAVLRTSTKSIVQDELNATSLHEWAGKSVVGAIEKLVK